MTDHSVEEIAEKAQYERVLAIQVEKGAGGEHQDERSEADFRVPVDVFEARVADRADHQVGDEDHQKR